MIDIKNQIDKLFETEYTTLINAAEKVLQFQLKRKDLATELVSQCYEYMIDNQHKFENINLKSIAITYIRYQIIWKGGKFKKDWIKLNERFNTNENDMIDEVGDNEELYQTEIDINNKLSNVFEYIKKQPLHKRILFDAVFIHGINTSGKLAKHTGLSRTGCYYLIKGLKAELKNNINEKQS